MDPFRIIIVPAAAREFNDLPMHVQERFKQVFNRLEDNPFRPRPGLDVIKMQGGGYRVHVGHYRGGFILEGRDVVFWRFGHRSTFYR